MLFRSVHMRHIGHPIVADRIYGGRDPVELHDPAPLELSVDEDEVAETADIQTGDEATAPVAVGGKLISRQALHAHRLQIVHPLSQQRLEFVAPLPDDILALLRALRST